MKIALLIAVVALSGNAVAGQAEDAAASNRRYEILVAVKAVCNNGGYVVGTEPFYDCVKRLLDDVATSTRCLNAAGESEDLYRACVLGISRAPPVTVAPAPLVPPAVQSNADASGQRYAAWVAASEECTNDGFIQGTDTYNNCVSMTPANRATIRRCGGAGNVDEFRSCVLGGQSIPIAPRQAVQSDVVTSGQAGGQSDAASGIRKLLGALLNGAAAYQASDNAYRVSHPPMQPPAAPQICSSYVNGQYITTRCW